MTRCHHGKLPPCRLCDTSPAPIPMTLDQIRRRMAWEAMRQRFAADDLHAPTADQLLADIIDPLQLAASATRQRHPLMALAWDMGQPHV